MAHFVRDFEPHPKRMAPDPAAPEAPVEEIAAAEDAPPVAEAAVDPDAEAPAETPSVEEFFPLAGI